MRKILILYCLLVFVNFSIAQNCVKNISTNPVNPVNDEFLPMVNNWFPSGGPYTVNSFLNTSIDWTNQHQIPIELQNFWSDPGLQPGPSGSTIFPMLSPFENANTVETNYIRDQYDDENHDSYWEDGWELMWVNLGRYPNGDNVINSPAGSYFYNKSYVPSPTHVPYFILYNRYRGVLRVFANAWFNPTVGRYQNVGITLRYTTTSENDSELSGILRHASPLDLAMDQYTKNLSVTSPRFQGPNPNQWMVADFQLAYDPCTCFSKGRFVIDFTTFDEMAVTLVSRGVTLEGQSITNYENEDFLNISGDVLTQSAKDGSKIYRSMGDLVTKHEAAVNKYNSDLDEYKSFNNVAKKTILDLAKSGFDGLANSNPLGSLAISFAKKLSLDKKIKKPEDLAKSATKSILGMGHDFLSMQLKVKSEPSPPSAPTASFTESYFLGTITTATPKTSTQLLVPGSTSGYVGGQSVGFNVNNYPAYNENVGLFALINTPELLIYEKKDIENEWRRNPYGEGYHPPNFEYFKTEDHRLIKLNSELSYKFNDAVDFNKEKTKVYASIELELESSLSFTESPSKVSTTTNLIASSSVKESNSKYQIVYNSAWVPIEDLGQELYQIDLEQLDFDLNPTHLLSTLKSVKLKILTDMYFDQPNHFGGETNTTQVFTYLLHTNNTPLSLANVPPALSTVKKYELGSIDIGTQEINPSSTFLNATYGNQVSVSTNTAAGIIYLDAEFITISGDVTVAPGWKLVLRAKEEVALLENGSVGSNVSFFTYDAFYNLAKNKEMTSTEINTFCTGPDYRANSTAEVANGIFPEIPDEEWEQMEEEMFKQDPEEDAGVKEVNVEGLIVQVYPNPASERVNVKINNLANENYQFKITDVSGKTLVFEKSEGSNNPLFQIDLKNINSGVYFLEVSNSNGLSEQSKLIIDK